MCALRIDAYYFGMIVINGVTYTRDIILLPDRVISNWRRRNGHLLIPEDIHEVLDVSPEILIVGTGSFDRMKISDAMIQEAKQCGIQLIAKPSGKAWIVYNQKANENCVVAAFHLTC